MLHRDRCHVPPLAKPMDVNMASWFAPLVGWLGNMNGANFQDNNISILAGPKSKYTGVPWLRASGRSRNLKQNGPPFFFCN